MIEAQSRVVDLAELDDADFRVTELRHRQANNFTMLAALVELRLRAAAEDGERRSLAWLRDAVSTLAELDHDLEHDDACDFGDHLARAASGWTRLCIGRDVDLLMQLGSVQVSAGQASALALVAHELVCNSLEHAFPDGRPGRITVRLSALGGRCELQVDDDGVGRPAKSQTARLGLRLVESMSRRLGGSLTLRDEPGFGATVRFPL